MSTPGQYCAKTFGLLSVESDWLYWMVGIQTGKVLVFGAWEMSLHKFEVEERESVISSIQNSKQELDRERMLDIDLKG